MEAVTVLLGLGCFAFLLAHGAVAARELWKMWKDGRGPFGD